MIRYIGLTMFVGTLALWSAGCVLVDAPGVKVGAISSPWSSSSRESGQAAQAAPHSEAMSDVLRRQDRVTNRLHQQNWDKLLDEVAKWNDEVLELATYAGSSHDPTRYRTYCSELIQAIHTFRQAARDRNPDRCRKAMEGCDAAINKILRDFPLSGAPSPPTPSPAADLPAPTRSSVPSRSSASPHAPGSTSRIP
ncbi:MAG: hypothetical protein GXY55_10105 [Phycisphaerae bacterium]|nr:hypothetical protein [Phycisphaerae bacterium]